MSKPLTEYVRTHRGGCYDDFIKECERIDAYVLKLELHIREFKSKIREFDNGLWPDEIEIIIKEVETL